MPCPACSPPVRRQQAWERGAALRSHFPLPPEAVAAGWTFDSFPSTNTTSPVVRRVIAFVKEESDYRNCYVHGDYGVGKSGLGIAAVRWAWEQRRPALYTTLPALLSLIRHTYDEGGSLTEEHILHSLEECDLLVVDDLGPARGGGAARPLSAWTEEKVFQLTNSRMLSGRRTLYTSNHRPEALRPPTILGDRIVERIEYRCLTLELAGPNWRRQ